MSSESGAIINNILDIGTTVMYYVAKRVPKGLGFDVDYGWDQCD